MIKLLIKLKTAWNELFKAALIEKKIPCSTFKKFPDAASFSM